MDNIHNATFDDNYLKSVRDGTLKQGLGIGCGLDENLVFKYGTFNLVMGRNNVGKTDWLLWYMVALSVRHKISWLVFSSENRIGSLKRKILQFWTGKDLANLTEDEFNEANRNMNFYFKFIKTDKLYEAGALLKIFEENKEQFDAAIIDPYNSLTIPSGVNQHLYDYEVAARIRLFCIKENKSVYIVAHAATDSLRRVHPKGHQYAGFPSPPNEADIEGGGKWGNKTDDFIVIHRYTSHKAEWMYTHVHVKKVRETETGGKPTFIDDPIVCYRHFNSFLIDRKDAITGETKPEKPLPTDEMTLFEKGEAAIEAEKDDDLPF